MKIPNNDEPTVGDVHRALKLKKMSLSSTYGNIGTQTKRKMEMGSLLNRIKNDRNNIRLENSRRTKLAKSHSDEHMIGALTTLYADAMRVGMDDGKRESTDDEVIVAVKKTIKGLEERLSFEYDDMIHTELCYINDYIPRQFTSGELEDRVNEFRVANPDAKIGQIMGWFKATHGGMYDGKMLSQVVKGLLL